jgi:hypothetical protein
MEYPFHNEADDWHKYPQSLFPNWTLEQQKKSGVSHLIRSSRVGYRSRFGNKITARAECSVYALLMLKTGRFHPDSSRDPSWKVPSSDGAEKEEALWKALTDPASVILSCSWIVLTHG